MLSREERKSNIELLKIFAMVLIIVSHSLPVYGDTSLTSYINLYDASSDIQIIIITFFRYLGQIGNCIFIVCSSYFLLDNNSVKTNKLWNIILDTIFFSLLYLILVKIILGYDIGIKNIMMSFMPITCDLNWFIGCYLLFYAIHPLLNIIINNIKQQTLLVVNIVTFFLYAIISFAGGSDKYNYNGLIGFIVIYFWVGYLKLYKDNFQKNLKMNKIILGMSILGLLILFGMTEIVGQRSNLFYAQMQRWDVFINPFIVFISITSLDLVEQKQFYNSLINKIAGYSLLIYIIHENTLVRSYLFPNLWQYIYDVFSYKYLIVWVLGISMVTFLLSLLIAYLYSISFMHLVRKVSRSCNNISIYIVNKVCKKMI